jgi:hypothetical protein
MRYALTPLATPINSETPGAQAFRRNVDFVKPLTVDFSYYLPGRYRLVMVLQDFDQKTKKSSTAYVKREIELRTPATAPVLAFENVKFTPRGTLLAGISVTDADQEAERQALRDPWVADFMFGYSLLAVDGKLAGIFDSENLSYYPRDSRWMAEIDLMQNLLITFNPLSPGKHMLSALVADRHGNLGITTREITLPLSYLKLVVDDQHPFRMAQPVLTGQPVVLQAMAYGGMAPEYCFLQQDGATWATVRDWAPDAAFRVTPATPGSYRYRVLAREGEKTLSAPLTLRVNAPCTGVKLTGAPGAPLPAGRPITVRAIADGGCIMSYRFTVFDGKRWRDDVGNWTYDRFTFTPEHAGTYRVKVEAIEEPSRKSFTNTVSCTVTAPAPLSGVTLAQQADSDGKLRPCIVDRGVMLQATRKGGTDGTVKYQFFSSPDGKQWNALGTALPYPVCQANFPRAGRRFFRVIATQATTGKRTSADLVLTARAPRPTTAITLTTSAPSPQPANTSILLGITENGDQNTYTPKVDIWFDGAWLPLKHDYFPGDFDHAWYPAEPGTYRLRATAETHDGKTLTTEITYTITAE